MRELEVTSLYDSVDERSLEDFNSKMNSTMRVKTDYFKDANSFEWLDVFEKLLPYIEKILRNPKRFITTEEEIVKIESAKKVGVETVKHLAKHTNIIQDLDEKTGDVIPSKLLNVLKVWYIKGRHIQGRCGYDWNQFCCQARFFARSGSCFLSVRTDLSDTGKSGSASADSVFEGLCSILC